MEYAFVVFSVDKNWNNEGLKYGGTKILTTQILVNVAQKHDRIRYEISSVTALDVVVVFVECRQSLEHGSNQILKKLKNLS